QNFADGKKLGGVRYEDATSRPWNRSDGDGRVEAILLEERPPEKPGDKPERTRFNLVPPEGGKYKEGQSAVFKEDGGKGRTLAEEALRNGQFWRFRWDLLLGNVVLNFLNFALGFACLWLLLRYQWLHALGLSVILWLVLTLAVMPPLFSQVRAAAPSTPPPKTAPKYPRAQNRTQRTPGAHRSHESPFFVTLKVEIGGAI